MIAEVCASGVLGASQFAGGLARDALAGSRFVFRVLPAILEPATQTRTSGPSWSQETAI